MAKAKNTFDINQEKVAISTLKMNNVMANIMGGMTKPDARRFLAKIGYTQREIYEIEGHW
jgi:hypothetical protein